MTITDHKPLTDRERYEMNRSQALHNYERAVEHAQWVFGQINEKRRKYQELEAELDSLEDEHTTALERVHEREEELTQFIKTRRHYEKDA